MILLKVSGIETYYGKIQALKGVSLEVEQGKIVTILGANGAGKTTTMKSIAGLLKPKTGKIEFLGKDVTGLRPDQLLKTRDVSCSRRKSNPFRYVGHGKLRNGCLSTKR